jgi:hypothetical protein
MGVRAIIVAPFHFLSWPTARRSGSVRVKMGTSASIGFSNRRPSDTEVLQQNRWVDSQRIKDAGRGKSILDNETRCILCARRSYHSNGMRTSGRGSKFAKELPQSRNNGGSRRRQSLSVTDALESSEHAKRESRLVGFVRPTGQFPSRSFHRRVCGW